MNPENPTTALVKTASSPTLARVSNQLALTDKLLTKPEEPFLIPYRQKDGYAPDSGGWGFANYWAFCNENGQIIFKNFFHVEPFVGGLAVVGDIRYAPEEYGGSYHTYFYYGFINRAGELLISHKFYSSVSPFSQGLSMVKSYGCYGSPATRVGFIDREGQEIVPCIYDDAFNFSDGLAAVKIDKYHEYDDYSRADEHWGFVNNSGNIIIPLEYRKAYPFSEKLSAVLSRVNYNWGYIDLHGQIVIPMQYAAAKSFSGNLAAVNKFKYNLDLDDGLEYDDPRKFYSYLWGFIDQFDNKVYNFIYDDVKSFSEGLAAVKVKNLWGFIDISGNEIVKFVYEEVSSFNEDIASVRVGDKWTFIDKTGLVINDNFYEQVFQYSQGRCGVKLNGKWGFIDKLGEIVIPIKYEWVQDFSGNISKVSLKDNIGYIGRNGREYWDV